MRKLQLTSHNLHSTGKVLFPGTGYLFLVWETFALMLGVPQMNLKVVFEEVKFMRATSMQKDQDISVTIVINRASGHFEITEGKTALAQGSIKAVESIEMSEVTTPDCENPNFMKEADFYKELRLRGYQHQGLFRAVTEIRTTFTDCLIQFFVVMKDSRMLILPTSLRKMVIDPVLHLQKLSQIEGDEKVLEVENCPYQRIIQCGGVEIHEFGGSSVNRRRQQVEPVLEAHKFISHHPSQILSMINMAKVCVQLALENEPAKEIVSVEVDANDNKTPLSEFILQSLADLPLITSKIKYLTKKSVEIDNVSVEDRELSQESLVNLVIKSNCIGDSDFLKTAKGVLNGKGFILSRENKQVRFTML
jgi:fatty acid synthase, animal type